MAEGLTGCSLSSRPIKATSFVGLRNVAQPVRGRRAGRRKATHDSHVHAARPVAVIRPRQYACLPASPSFRSLPELLRRKGQMPSRVFLLHCTITSGGGNSVHGAGAAVTSGRSDAGINQRQGRPMSRVDDRPHHFRLSTHEAQGGSTLHVDVTHLSGFKQASAASALSRTYRTLV
jgi:hypothetical protein